jgi:RNA polymerase sigma-70 factor (ECF subfamily)
MIISGTPKVCSDAAYADFYQAVIKRTVKRALWFYHDLPDAQDAAQEALLAVYRQWQGKVSGLDEEERWRFVVTVLANKWKSECRRQPRAERAMRLLGWRHEISSSIAHLDNEVLSRETVRAVRNLPPQQRVIAALHWIEGMTLVEAAEMLGISASTARTHLDRARNTLRKQVGEPGLDFHREASTR